MFSALIASAIVVDMCSWDNPGANRFIGNVPAAVHNYTDIPKPVRDVLVSRLEKRKYDEIVEIRKDKISGKANYSNLRDMHFGKNRICKTVSRSKWSDSSVERALIYCEKEYCIAVPTICGNVSRVTKTAKEEDEPLDINTSAGGNSNALGNQSFIDISQQEIPINSTVLNLPDVHYVKHTPDNPQSFPPHFYPPYNPPPGYTVPPPPIPEIPSLAMMLIGFCVVLSVARRKKQNK